MGANIARRLTEKGWRVIGYNRTAQDTRDLEKERITGAYSLKEVIRSLQKPRILWLMLPAGKAIDEIIFGTEGFIHYADKDDIIIDAGNSYYKDSRARAEKLKKYGIHYVDVGFSGGPSGARNGGCLMVGGEEKLYEYLFPLFLDVATIQGVSFFKGTGAGHFVKMIHNGIEYGMMQSLAEGFDILKHSQYKLDLAKVADIYNHGSVIESRLVGWLENALQIYGQDLKQISSTVAHTGEGTWTIKTAEELGVKAKVIEETLKFRINSKENPSFTGKILTALRNQFGGHNVK